jgi:predicted component of type VI protein secretion system
MRALLLAGLVLVILAGCASNKAADAPGTRVREDTTMTAKLDTTHGDTLPHIRDTVPDSTSR